jgi:hypothetical protein
MTRGRTNRRTAATLVAALLLLLGAALPAASQQADDAADNCYPVPEGGCDEEDGDPSFVLDVLGPLCVGTAPYLEWSVVPQAIDGDRVDISFVNPDGPNIVYPNQPLSGRLLWPGAEVDSEGEAVDWPGWQFIDGRWVELDDGFAFTRDNVLVRVELNPTAEERVAYPPPTSDCAGPNAEVLDLVLERPDPSTTDVASASSVLALTGTEVVGLTAAAVVLMGVGGVLAGRSRRKRSSSEA